MQSIKERRAKAAAAAREYYWLHKDDPEFKAKARARNATWRERNRERQNAQSREYRSQHPGYSAMKSREWREKNPEKARESCRKWYANHGKEYNKAEYARNRDWILLRNTVHYHEIREMFRTDAEAYADFRKKHRDYNKKRWDKKRKGKYRPKLSMRIPDWACMGEDLLKRGTMLANAYTPEMLGANLNHKLIQGASNGRR